MRTEIDFNWQIIGHKRIKQFLQRNVVNESISHAYLFFGPEKVGKTLSAKKFAQSLLCENYDHYQKTREIKGALPCGICSACVQFEKKIYPDLYIVERETNEKTGKKKGQIAVGQIRELLGKVAKRSFMNSYKIVLIPEAQLLSKEASNCLLKTLEEPTPRTIIILISPNKDLLLSTILSRVQLIKFLPVTRQSIYDYLLGRGASRNLAKELASMAQGRPTIAMKMFNKEEQLTEYQFINKELLQLLGSGIIDRFQFIEKMAGKKTNNEEIIKKLNYLSALTRDVLLAVNYRDDLLTNQFLIQELKQFSNKYSAKRLAKFLEKIEQSKKLLSQNVSPRLLLENLLLNI